MDLTTNSTSYIQAKGSQDRLSALWRPPECHVANKLAELFRSEPGADLVGAIGAIAPLKPKKATSFTMILYNSENSIRDIRPFCRPFFCHSSVVMYISSLLQKQSRYET